MSTWYKDPQYDLEAQKDMEREHLRERLDTYVSRMLGTDYMGNMLTTEDVKCALESAVLAIEIVDDYIKRAIK